MRYNSVWFLIESYSSTATIKQPSMPQPTLATNSSNAAEVVAWDKKNNKALGTILLYIAVVEHGVYPVFYSVFSLFLPILLSPLEAFLAFAQSKRPSQRLTKCVLLFFFLTPIRRPSIPVVHQLF
jgi:hypothetical protein